MKYSTKITSLGCDALAFLEDEDNNFIIIFNDNCPSELKEVAILHEIKPLLADLSVGDTVIICDKVYDISAIGSEAQHTLKELGHCTLCFKGGNEPDRPGCIMLEGDPMTSADIKVGGTIEIF